MKRLKHLLLFAGVSILIAGSLHAQVEILPKGQLLRYHENQLLQRSSNSSLAFDFDLSQSADGWETQSGWQWQGQTGFITNAWLSQYANQADYTLVSPRIRIPAATNQGVYLLVEEKFDLESNHDNGLVEISTDGNTWHFLDVRSGSSGGEYIQKYIDITRYAGAKAQIRFQLTTDADFASHGWQVRKVGVFTRLLPGVGTVANAFTPLNTVQSSCMNTNIISINAQSFPNSVYLNVNVSDENGQAIRGLTRENFRLIENGDPQNCLEVIPPGSGGNVRRADIVFLMDNSGSLDDEQAQVKQNVYNFVDALANAGIDYALGLVRFGQTTNNGFPILEDNGALTSDKQYFKDQVWTRNIAQGGNEPIFDAIVDASTDMQWRANSQRIIILVTDESPTYDYNPCLIRQTNQTQNDALTALQNQGVTFYAISDTLTGPPFYQTYCNNQTYQYFGRVDNRGDLMPLVNATNGVYYPILDPFQTVLDNIATQIASSYVISYRSCNPASDVARELSLTVSDGGECSGTSGLNYTPDHCPTVNLAPGTQAMLGTAVQPGNTITIAATIGTAPFAPQPVVKLWYRTTGSATYSFVPMQLQGNGTYSADVTALAPGVDFYITADGDCYTSLPSFDPQGTPFQVAIAPGQPLFINHVQPMPPFMNNNVEITAEVLNNSPSATTVTLYYKKANELNFSNQPMAYSNGQFRYTLPANYVNEDCIEYFIIAENGNGVRRILPENGTNVLCETPLVVSVNQTEACPATSNSGNVTLCASGSVPPYRFTIGGVTQIATSCATFQGLPAGTYNAYISQSSCCAPVKTIQVTVGGCNPDSCLLVSETHFNDGCDPLCKNKPCSGSIDLSINRGTAPYTYEWSNGEESEDLRPLCPGTYSVNITDARGCKASRTIVIQPRMELMVTSVEPTCGADGKIHASVSGGVEPYSYALNENGDYTAEAYWKNVSGGNHTVWVQDATGCKAVREISLNEVSPIHLNLSADAVDCNGAATGSVISSVAGGEAPYTYHWSNGSTMPHLLGLTVGHYTLDVADAKGCHQTATVEITENDPIVANITVENGCLVFDVQGGSGEYKVSIDNAPFRAMERICDLAEGPHLIQIKDSKCCSVYQIVTVDKKTPPPPSCPEIQDLRILSPSQIHAYITWQALPNVTAYSVEYRVAGSDMWSRPMVSNGTTVPIYDLTPGTRYEVRVSYECGGNLITAKTTFETLPATNSCGIIQNFNIAPKSTSASVFFVPVPGAVNHIAELCKVGSAPNCFQTSVNGSNELYGLTPGTVYTIRIRAVFNENGNFRFCEYSQPYTFTTIPARTGETFVTEMMGAYPNPTTGLTTLSLEVSSDRMANIEVFDLAGNRVLSQTANLHAGANTIDLDISSLTTGVYQIVMTAENATLRTKVVKVD